MSNRPGPGKGSTSRTMACLFLAALAAASASVCAQSTYYRWTDEAGNTILSDRPPPGDEQYEIESAPAPASYEQLTADESNTENPEDAANEPVAVPVSGKEKSPELCSRARDTLEALAESDTVTMQDGQGEARTLGPDEVEAIRLKTQAQVERYCGE